MINSINNENPNCTSSVTPNRYRFTPKPLATIATVVIFGLLMSLGFWQINRADTKKQLIAEYQSRAKSSAIPLQQLPAGKQQQYRAVKVNGQYLPQQQLLLDNRFYQHHIGFEVITPMAIPGDSKLLLVNRGWVARHMRRSQLPDVNVNNRPVTIKGIVVYPSSKAIVLSPAMDNPKQWPRIIQKLDAQQMAQILNHPVYPFVVRLKSGNVGSLQHNWQPVVMPPRKHYAYAFQWFALAGALLVIFIIVNLERKDVES